MKKAVVGGVLSMDSGRRFGFKISIEDAISYKRHIVKVLMIWKENIVVDVEKGYHE